MAEKKAFPELRTYIGAGSGVSLGPVLLRHIVRHIDAQAAEIERLKADLTSKRQAVLLTDEQIDALADEVFDLIQDVPDDDVGDRTWDRMFGRAIETAVLAANNLEVRRG